MHYAANHRWASWGDASLAGHLEVFRVLLTPSDGPFTFSAEACTRLASARDEDGATAMHAAAHSGRAELIVALHAAGCPSDAPPGTFSPVHVAASHGRTEVLRLLLSLTKSSGLEAADERGLTPLGVAAAHGAAEAVLLLAAAGCSLDSCGGDRLPPLLAASHSGCAATVAVLLALGCRRGLAEAVAASAALVRRCATAVEAAVEPAAAAVPRRQGERARVALRTLRVACRRVPLVWSTDCHSEYPARFRERVRTLLFTCSRIHGLAALPTPLQEIILHDHVIALEASEEVWPFLSPHVWRLVGRAQAVRVTTRRIYEPWDEDDAAEEEEEEEDADMIEAHGDEDADELAPMLADEGVVTF